MDGQRLVEKEIKISRKGYQFGTAPVFLTSVCSILGAIMFLRFGYAVGNLGLMGALGIVILGHLITIPTGLAISEIATNLKVGGGGEYFIISRSFGVRIGSTIGVMLYASQAISISFYIIAFSEMFKSDFFSPYIAGFEAWTNLAFDTRFISLPVTLLLFLIILKRGAKMGIGVLWGVFVLLILAVIIFMLGSPIQGTDNEGLTTHIRNSDSFITVFAICFPAFTGMTAGVGLSGDLKNPRKSIPGGVLLAIFTGLIIYTLIVLKLYFSASVTDLANDQFIMYNISVWGPIILVGLTAATLSSAVGFILISPRTLQALGNDKIFPHKKINHHLGKGVGVENEPRNALVISLIISIIFIALGNLNAVAQIITMFFLITYGSVCLISFLEHFAGNPSYRPTFRTKWYFSFMGTVLCFGLMFFIEPLYALIAILIMIIIYKSLEASHREARSFAVIFQGVMFQLSRRMKIALQKSGSKPDKFNWRPSVIAFSSHAVDRSAPKDILDWVSDYYGFGTLVHFTKGPLDKRAVNASRRIQKELIKQLNVSKANYSVTSVVSPSLKTAVFQGVQFSDIAGMNTNTILFEFNKNRSEELPEIVDSCKLAEAIKFNIWVLRATEDNFGAHKKIHIWLSEEDFQKGKLNNGNLMILLSYIIMAHPDWKNSEVKIFTAFPSAIKNKMVEKIRKLIIKGRLPIALKNIVSYPYKDKGSFIKLVNKESKNADLVIVGFTLDQLKRDEKGIFEQFDKLQDTLFVYAGEDIFIS